MKWLSLLALVGCNSSTVTVSDVSRYKIQVCVDQKESTKLRKFIPGYKIAGYDLACNVVDLECSDSNCSWSVAER
jgi:hypothetical protein